MNKPLLAVLIAVALTFSGRSAGAGPMPCPDGKTYADYAALGANGCLLGDKVFSNFVLNLGPNTGTGTTPKSNQIVVTPLSPANNPGLRFTGTPPFHAPPLPGPPTFFSYRFGYNVRVQAGGLPIGDVSLAMAAPTVAADGSVTIQELLCLGGVFESKGICAGNKPMAQLNAFDMPAGTQLTDSITFTQPYRLIGTQTLLIADAGLAGSASVASFTQQFSRIGRTGAGAKIVDIAWVRYRVSCHAWPPRRFASVLSNAISVSNHHVPSAIVSCRRGFPRYDNQLVRRQQR